MPKFGAHIIIAESAKARRPDLFNNLADNALRLGSIGPDLTLFLFDIDPITDPTVRRGYDVAIEVLRDIRAIKRKIAEIEKIFEGPKKDIEDWVTGHLSNDLRETLELAIKTLLLAAKLGLANGASSFNIQNPLASLISKGEIPANFLKDPALTAPSFLIDSVDNCGFPFRYFGHPLTDDGKWKKPLPTGDYSEWWWMDMLHYRKTGTFAKTLLSKANDPITQSYARGYMSHVAGDICGHPFINALVGGPFRNHAYRHLVLESLADTWLWNQQRQSDITNSSLNDLISLPGNDVAKISNLIVDAMRSVYTAPMLPNRLKAGSGYPVPSELATAYGAMLFYLELSTTETLVRPKSPPDNPEGLLKEIQGLLSRNTPGNPPSWNPSNPLDSIVAVLGYLWRGIVLLAMIATLPMAVLKRFLTIGPRWLLYLIKLAIYMVVSGLRTLLAFMGWGYASKEDFATFGFLEEMVTFSQDSDGYPRTGVPRKPPYYWMIPPQVFSAPIESESTIVGPIPKGSRPNWLIDENNQVDFPEIAKFLSATTPSETRQAERDALNAGSTVFGNAPDFCNALLDNQIPVPDLDLDGDRGFGYKSWEEQPPKERYI